MNYKIYFNEKWEKLKQAYNNQIKEGRTTYDESTNLLKFVGEEIPNIIMKDLEKFNDLPDELKHDNRVIQAYIESYFIYYNLNNCRNLEYENYIPDEVETGENLYGYGKSK